MLLKKPNPAFRLLTMLLAVMMVLSPVSAKALETSVPEETLAVETTPVETTPVVTEPVETTPVETIPEETEPVQETVPEETTLSGYPEGVEVEIVPGLDTLPIPEEIDHYDEVPLYFQTDYPHHMYGN